MIIFKKIQTGCVMQTGSTTISHLFHAFYPLGLQYCRCAHVLIINEQATEGPAVGDWTEQINTALQWTLNKYLIKACIRSNDEDSERHSLNSQTNNKQTQNLPGSYCCSKILHLNNILSKMAIVLIQL